MKFDVAFVGINSGKVEVVDDSNGVGYSQANAEAVVKREVMRRGVETQFYAAVPHGRFKVGDRYASTDPMPEGLR